MILDNVDQFIDKILKRLEVLGIDVSHLEMDHIGYQASSNEDYDRLKPEFEQLGTQISEEVVGGRRVGIYKLNTPIQFQHYIISAIELVAPKEGQICISALEHVEFVIKEDFQSFVKKYPQLSWDLSKINQPMFPMVVLKLDNTTQVKFHLKPVLEIVCDGK